MEYYIHFRYRSYPISLVIIYYNRGGTDPLRISSAGISPKTGTFIERKDHLLLQLVVFLLPSPQGWLAFTHCKYQMC